MNTKLVAGFAVMVLLLGVTSHSLTGYAFALDAKGLGEKAKTSTNSTKVSDSTAAKSADNPSTAKLNPPKVMTKVEGQKANREKQMAEESVKTAKDKAKVDAFKSAKTKADAQTAKDKANTKK